MAYEVSDVEFQELVEAAIAALPDEFRRAVTEDVPVRVDRRPSRRLLRELGMNDDELLLGLHEGPSRGEQAELLLNAGGAMPALPARISLFKEDIEDVSEDRDDLVEQVRVTLLHELGHYFGLDEDDLERLGYQ